MKDYIFLSGIHGVGKTTLANRINEVYPIYKKSVSDLIRSAGKGIEENDKSTSDIDNNQLLWKEELNRFPLKNKILMLDGHFSLLNQENEVVPLAFETFEGTNMKKIILKKEKSIIIQDRLKNRDNRSYPIELIDSFQLMEEKRANLYAKINSIPIFIYDHDDSFSKLIKFRKE
ncbi:AAA family ATPase [Enterococcus faecalis]|uniref:AAA family ATPase n=1 Tax=Enterococcus faecalis TaxID=1351 RepID=UPI0040416472